MSSAFISKGKIAKVKDVEKQVAIDDYETDHLNNLTGLPSIEAIFPAYLGKLILKTENSVILYDLTNKYLNKVTK